MAGLAPWLAALALAQGEPSPPAEAPPAIPERAPAVAPAEAPAPAPSSSPAPPSAPAAPPDATPAPAGAAPAPTVRPPRPPVRPTGSRPPRPPAASAPQPSAAAERPATPVAAPRQAAEPERDAAARAARAFLTALVAGDADALAAASAERFSFDGELQSGRDAVRRTWRSLLAGRPGPAPRVDRLEVLTASDAIARHGPPPPRIAPLARPGTFVAIADVSGRTVVLFLAREAGRLAVTGMHD